MRVIVYLPLVLPVFAALFARPLAERLDPRWAAWLLTAASLGLAGASTVALGLLAATAVIRIPLVASLGHWSGTTLGHDDPAGIGVAVAAGVLLGAVLLAAGHFTVRRYRALADAYRHARALPDTGIVVTGHPAPDAYAVPGRPGRVVVTAGMLDALDEPGHRVLLAHERAHLAGFHHLFIAAARLAAAANPLLRPAAAAVEYSVERWSDEQAAAEVGDRVLVARTIAAAALAGKHGGPRRRLAGALGFGAARPHLPTGAGPVPRRVAALLAPPPDNPLLLVFAAAVVVAAAGVCALEAARDLHTLLKTANTLHRH